MLCRCDLEHVVHTRTVVLEMQELNESLDLYSFCGFQKALEKCSACTHNAATNHSSFSAAHNVKYANVRLSEICPFKNKARQKNSNTALLCLETSKVPVYGGSLMRHIYNACSHFSALISICCLQCSH